MPRPAVQLILFFCWSLPVAAVHVQIRTVSPSQITGEITAVDAGIVYLKTDAYQAIGIPIEKIEILSPDPHIKIKEFAPEILQLRDILHLWDPSTKSALLSYTENLANQGDWIACFRSASCVEASIQNPGIAARATELKALALFKMGLHKQSADALDSMALPVNPIHSSARVCWIRAQLAMLTGNREAAISWALIPKLRIPCDASPIADKLYNECQDWLDQNR